jgi:hypothetical protein
MEVLTYVAVGKHRKGKEEHCRRRPVGGPDPDEVTLVAATKVQARTPSGRPSPPGSPSAGEPGQELTAHLADNAYDGARVHFIGHLPDQQG